MGGNIGLQMPGVNPITGFVNAAPEAPPFEQQGGPVNSYHGHWGQQASPYPWEVIPMGPYPGSIDPLPGIIDDAPMLRSLEAGFMAQDQTADQTPAYHAAPFPNEGPGSKAPDQLDVHGRAAGSARQLAQSFWVHAHNTGAGLKRLFLPQMLAKQDQWTGFFNEVPGNDIVPSIPGSVSSNAGGFGANDHVSNAFRKENQFGYNTSHRHRRFATGSIPGNTQWLKPGGRPMVRTLTGIHQFPVSGAFAGDDPAATFSYQGAILTNTPAEYAAPAQPTLSPAIVDTQSAGQTIPEIPLF